LVQAIVGVDDASYAQVGRATCDACCTANPPPTEQDINPVVASVLFTTCERLLAAPQYGGCSLEKLLRLHKWAEECIPIVRPGEDDSGARDELQASLAAGVTVDDIVALLPLPTNMARTRMSQMAVGVTTAPRRQETLDTCLTSVSGAGWPRMHLFVDGDAVISGKFERLCAARRRPQVGAWMNYVLSLRQLLVLEPAADTLLMLQDDVLFPSVPAIRKYIETMPWPSESPALVSLYCSADYTAEQHGWCAWTGTWCYGALAFVFPRELAEAFLEDEIVNSYGAHPTGSGTGGIDTIIGQWADRNGVSVYRPTPSLVQHIGDVSSLWPTLRAVGLRRAGSYLGDLLGRKRRT
jgi:hypothetical protein